MRALASVLHQIGNLLLVFSLYFLLPTLTAIYYLSLIHIPSPRDS